MWEAQAGKFMTSKKVDIDFCLPEFSATKIVKRKFHVYESTTGRYIMILVRYLLTALGLDHKLSDNIIIGVNGPYEEVSSAMVDVSKHDFTYLTEKTVKTKESFINLYVDKCLEYKSAIISTRRISRILDG